MRSNRGEHRRSSNACRFAAVRLFELLALRRAADRFFSRDSTANDSTYPRNHGSRGLATHRPHGRHPWMRCAPADAAAHDLSHGRNQPSEQVFAGPRTEAMFLVRRGRITHRPSVRTRRHAGVLFLSSQRSLHIGRDDHFATSAASIRSLFSFGRPSDGRRNRQRLSVVPCLTFPSDAYGVVSPALSSRSERCLQVNPISSSPSYG